MTSEELDRQHIKALRLRAEAAEEITRDMARSVDLFLAGEREDGNGHCQCEACATAKALLNKYPWLKECDGQLKVKA